MCLHVISPSKLFKNVQFERENFFFFFNIPENVQENQSLKVVFWKDYECALISTK